jgi:uncharacterized delta-60 repeat protein
MSASSLARIVSFSTGLLLCVPVLGASLDSTFNPGSGPNDIVTCIAVRTNGQVLIGGLFTSISGESRTRVARLNANGSLDASFTPFQGPDGHVWAIAPDDAGKVVIGGSFNSVNSIQRNYFARLRADGSLDLSLTNILFNGNVRTIKILPDGSYLVIGAFTSVNNVSRPNVARLHSNGGLDLTFNPASKVSLASGPVLDAAILPNSQVLLAGQFTTIDNTNRAYVARVSTDGTLDTTFDAGFISGASVMTSVAKLLIQQDGKLIIAGDFFSVDGYSRRSVARLWTNGAVDTAFVVPEGLSYDIRGAMLQHDGRPVFVGGFSYPIAPGVTRGYFVRLNQNGSLDTTYYPRLSGSAPSSSGSFYAVALQDDGKVLVGGAFNSINGTNLNHIARLHSDDSPRETVQLLAPNRYFGTFLSGAVSNRYRIEWTTNLNTNALWNPMLEVALQSNVQFILDPIPIAGRERYYRAVELP